MDCIKNLESFVNLDFKSSLLDKITEKNVKTILTHFE